MPLGVPNFLAELGPCLSRYLVDALVARGLKLITARQRDSRARHFEGVKRLAHLPFPGKARFIYLEKEYGSPNYWRALHKIIIERSPSYGPALAALLQRDGIIPTRHFAAA